MKIGNIFSYILTSTLCIFALVSCQPEMYARNDSVTVHTVEDFSSSVETLNSHAGLETSSVLEPMYDYVQVLQNDFLMSLVPDNAPKQKVAVYPRIKKMSDGRFIMFYQGASVASRIFYTFSNDLRSWEEPRLLWGPYNVTTVEGKDVRRFTTADAVVLPDGDILAVCSYRASSGYKNGIGCGLTLKRSSDNGKTWSSGQAIYEGTNWEPYLLYLPDGTIHCYFTDCIPSIKDSGTSLIVSRDGGKTWGEYKKVSRQYKYESDGHKIFTDQMPSVRLLNDGKTLCGFFEARLEPDFPAEDAKSIFKMSLVYNDGFEWKDLGDEGEGPEDRQTNVFDGAGGYISVFPSGETLISCNISGEFSMKLGDASARRFNGRTWATDWLQPFEGRAFWGATEVVSDHEVAGAVYAPEGLNIGKFYLNHAVEALEDSIAVDGDGKEWRQDHVFYLGSDSHTQAIIRTAYDENNLYLLIERKGDTAGNQVYTDISLHNASAEDFQDGASVFARVSSSGLDDCHALTRNGKGKNVKAMACVQSGYTATGEKGTVTELSVPLSALGAGKGDVVMLNAELVGPGLKDGFTGTRSQDPSTWMKILL